MIMIKLIKRFVKHNFLNQNFFQASKMQPIKFCFKIPSKTKIQTIVAADKNFRITSAKRNSESQTLGLKKLEDQKKSKIRSQFTEQQRKILVQNLKTIHYHQKQYFQGEHLIENIQLNPFYSYKLADFKRKLIAKRQNDYSILEPIKDYEKLANNKFQTAINYNEKLQKYQVQQFLKYLQSYPGSPKGPKPEDDLDYFIQYARKKMPSILEAQLTADNSGADYGNVKDLDETMKFPAEASYSSILGIKRPLERPPDQDYRREQVQKNIAECPIYKEHQEFPDIPELPFTDYQSYMKELMNWRNFKNYYLGKHASQICSNQFDYLLQVGKQNDPEPHNKYFKPTGNAPSILRYYKTLPQQLQDHPGIKDICLGLEFHSPYIPYKEKQEALNLACTMALPLDKVSQRAMEDFIEKKKYYITPFIADKIFTINPEFTWDVTQFFDQIKREQLKGQSMIKENQRSYPEPPQVHLDWEEGSANLPIDFYDNSESFWDSLISQKLQRQDKAAPIMKRRKHFKH